MAELRKVQFVTLSAFAAGAAAEARKRRLEEEGEFSPGRAGEEEAAGGAGGAAAAGAGGGGGAGGDRSRAKARRRATVRLNLTLSEPSDVSSVEFNYGELIQNLQVGPLDSHRAFSGVGPLLEYLWLRIGGRRHLISPRTRLLGSIAGPQHKDGRRGAPVGGKLRKWLFGTSDGPGVPQAALGQQQPGHRALRAAGMQHVAWPSGDGGGSS